MSAITLTIPKSGLTAGLKPAQLNLNKSPRYFHFEDSERHVVISGWYESADHFTSARQVWEGDVAAWKRNGTPAPKNISFQKIADWDTVSYQLSMPSGNDCNLRAQLVQAGTWIDLHISAYGTLDVKQLQSELVQALTSIKVTQRAPVGQ